MNERSGIADMTVDGERRGLKPPAKASATIDDKSILTADLSYIRYVYMRTKIFKSGNSKAVRIPASVELSGSEVEIIDLGEKGILLKPLQPTRDPWDLFREGIEELGEKWPDRVQEEDQARADW